MILSQVIGAATAEAITDEWQGIAAAVSAAGRLMPICAHDRSITTIRIIWTIPSRYSRTGEFTKKSESEIRNESRAFLQTRYSVSNSFIGYISYMEYRCSGLYESMNISTELIAIQHTSNKCIMIDELPKDGYQCTDNNHLNKK